MKRTKQEKIFYYTQPGLYQRTIDQLENTEEKVIWILNYFEGCRDSDTALLYVYWLEVDKAHGKMKQNLKNLTPAETITRCRRKIQNTLGLYLPVDPQVRIARKIKEDAFRDWARRGL